MGCDYHTQVSLSISAIGPEPVSYQWKNDGVDIVNEDCIGIDESTLTIRSFSLKHQGNYSCEVKHKEKSVESDPAKLKLSKQLLLFFNLHSHVNFQIFMVCLSSQSFLL